MTPSFAPRTLLVPLATLVACASTSNVSAPAATRGHSGCSEQIANEPEPVEGSSALARARIRFRNAYEHARTLMLAGMRPIIVAHFRYVVLLRKGRPPIEELYTPEVYDALATVSHMPLVIFAAGRIHEADAKDASWAEHLAALRSELPAVEAELDRLALSDDLRARQRQILHAPRELIDAALSKGSLAREEVATYAVAMKALVLENADAAAATTLARLHEIVERWRGELSAEEWAALKVVIPVARMPREGYVPHQYFARLLGPEAVDERLFFAEGLWACDDAVSLLGTVAIDRDVATTFFEDGRRMDRDLLSDGARKYLDRLFPAR